MSNEAVDGVIKFQLEHESRLLEPFEINEINAWRSLFKQLGILGQDAGRYDGYGFGNLSQRTESGFLISGTQTGHMENLVLADYAEVTSWNPMTNSVVSKGMARPSSESMSHAVIYDAKGQVGCVFHVHSPDIWQKAIELQLPVTDTDIPYGSPEMARSVKKIVTENKPPFVLSMGGHEDGIIAYGGDLSETGHRLIQTLVLARM